MPPAHIALAVLCTVIWGLNFVVIKWGLVDFPPLLFAALRFMLASLPFLPFVKPPRTHWKWVVGIGVFLCVGQFGFLYAGMNYGMPAGLSSAVLQTQVFFTVIFAVAFIGERPRWQSLIGMALAFAGVAVIAGHLGGVPWGPFLMVISGAVCWAVSNVITRRAASPDAFGLIVWASLVAPVPLLALSWIIEGQSRIVAAIAGPSWLGLGSVVYIAFLSTNLAYGTWTLLLKKHPAASVAPFALMVPFWGIASSWLLLGERLDAAKLIGAGLIVAGVAANSWPMRGTRGPTRRSPAAASR
jgi:O-acetylserine/cysteine efflux transporter